MDITDIAPTIRHRNRPNAIKPVPRSVHRRNRCSCKGYKVGAWNEFTDRERLRRQIQVEG